MRTNRAIEIIKRQLQEYLVKVVSNSSYGYILMINDNKYYYVQFMMKRENLYLEASSNFYLPKKFKLSEEKHQRMQALGWEMESGGESINGNIGEQSNNYYAYLSEADLFLASNILTQTLLDIFGM